MDLQGREEPDHAVYENYSVGEGRWSIILDPNIKTNIKIYSRWKNEGKHVKKMEPQNFVKESKTPHVFQFETHSTIALSRLKIAF